MTRKKSLTNTKKYTCKHCGKSFAKEKTLETHPCKIRDRVALRSEKYVEIAFALWKSIVNGVYTKKTIDNFERDSTYTAFTEFVKYAQEQNYLFIFEFGIWLLKNKVVERNWYKSEIYHQFLKQHLLTENPRQAVIRSIDYISNIYEIGNFFKTCQVGKILTYIETGRISPWLIFLSDNSDEFLSRLENEKLTYFTKLVNIDVWQSRMRRYEKTMSSLKEDLKGVKI